MRRRLALRSLGGVGRQPALRASAQIFTGAVLSAILMGCATTPLSRYPQFAARKATLGKLVVLADVTLLRDIPGDVDAVDLEENKLMAEVLFARLTEKMKVKGYVVDRTVLASVGMLLRAGTTLHVIRSPEDRGRNPLPMAVEPFYVDSNLDQDPVLRQAWESILRPKSPSGPAASRIGRALQADTLLIVYMKGRTVPWGKSLGQVIVTLGMYAEESIIGMAVVIGDAQSGSVMWRDEIVLPKQSPNPSGIDAVVRFVVDRLP
jgi:hypothetical protein